ncbi:methyltransferase domain-containing protein [Streptomyces sp. NBC_01445]|uniref:methyltransferase domain-containing protein n=1 Tax=Streptomyces sp. NBC_01445 TaxID=2903869 RepID=UPI002DDA7C73|nr:methyltransferase domain-containing protein [Streptomyces sp. NBC_01445]WSE03799.1 methyltransferase domain-containing protein [Streptomyces sp. NBC_01445]
MNWPDTDTAVALRQKYAADLVADPDDPWHRAFASVPRHVFTPRFFMQPSGRWQPVNWGDPGYLETVYSDAALTTQLDELGIPTSSSSQPSLMLAMLEALDVHQGQRVLELGTGTGYNLALLAARLGDKNLVSVEPDTQLVDLALRRLEQAGYRPVVIAGDGTLGHVRRAPYDRIIATVGLTHIPPALLDQATPGAVLVAPLGYGLVRLVLTGTGHASGRFLKPPARFMAVRGPATHPDLDTVRGERPTSTTIALEDVLDRLTFAMSIALPGYTSSSWHDDKGQLEAVGLWLPDGSTAVADASGHVRQSGPSRVWDTVEDLAKTLPPHIDRPDFCVTVTPIRQTVTYGEPSGPSWHLPSTGQ